MSFDPRLIAKMRGQSGIDESMIADLIAYNATDQARFNNVSQLADEEDMFRMLYGEIPERRHMTKAQRARGGNRVVGGSQVRSTINPEHMKKFVREQNTDNIHHDPAIMAEHYRQEQEAMAKAEERRLEQMAQYEKEKLDFEKSSSTAPNMTSRPRDDIDEFLLRTQGILSYDPSQVRPRAIMNDDGTIASVSMYRVPQPHHGNPNPRPAVVRVGDKSALPPPDFNSARPTLTPTKMPVSSAPVRYTRPTPTIPIRHRGPGGIRRQPVVYMPPKTPARPPARPKGTPVVRMHAPVPLNPRLVRAPAYEPVIAKNSVGGFSRQILDRMRNAKPLHPHLINPPRVGMPKKPVILPPPPYYSNVDNRNFKPHAPPAGSIEAFMQASRKKRGGRKDMEGGFLSSLFRLGSRLLPTIARGATSASRAIVPAVARGATTAVSTTSRLGRLASTLGRTASVLGTVAPLAFTAYQIADTISAKNKEKEQAVVDALDRAEAERQVEETKEILRTDTKRANDELAETERIKKENDIHYAQLKKDNELQRKRDEETLKKMEADYQKMYEESQLATQRAVDEQIRQLIANSIDNYSTPLPTPTPPKNTPPIKNPATTNPSRTPTPAQRTPSLNNLNPASRRRLNNLYGSGVKHDLNDAIVMCMNQDPSLSSRALCAHLNDSGISTSQATVTRRLKKLRDEGKL